MEQVLLSFSAYNLPNVTTLGAGQIDPFISIEIGEKSKNLVGCSEVIMNTQAPKWASSFVVTYSFEMTQIITVKVYHKCSSTPVGPSPKHTYMGSTSFLLSEVMTRTSSLFKKPFGDGSAQGSGGQLFVQAEAVSNTRDVFIAKFQCAGLNRMNGLGIFGKSDPFLEVSKMYENGTYGVCYKTMHIKSELNPHWPECKIPMIPLCNGDLDRPMKIAIWDFEDTGKHKSMGEVNTTIRALMRDGASGFDIIEPEKKAKGGGYTNSGHLKCVDCQIEHHPTFTEFIRGGMELSLMVAIDFTASNGDPKDRGSLHHFDANSLNPYQSAISQVGKVVEPYDTDHRFPVWGFGGRVRQSDGTFTPVQHCFTVAEDAPGCAGVLQAYENFMPNVGLSGPTLFGNILDTAGAIAASANCTQELQKYFILLIITDGIINDIDATKLAIARASGFPLSIIIVGVGNEDFSQMKTLDGDDALLTSTSGKHKAERDIVQFVAMRELVGKGESAVAQEVLAEVPNQVLQYMKKRNILPNAARGK